MHRLAGVALTLALVTGCSAPEPKPNRDTVPPSALASPTPAASTPGRAKVIRSGCGRPLRAPAGANRLLSVAVDPATAEGQRSRTALVHVPAGYRPQRPHPILLVYHGHGGTASGTASATGFSDLADRNGFLAVYPQGLPDGRGGPPMWASAGAVDHGIEELPATNRLLDILEADYCVDTGRVYATGISNGGGMANYLACRLADRISAVAPVVGNMYPPKDGGCTPSRPVSILDVHAVDDAVVPYQGGGTDPTWVLPAVTTWLAQWAVLDGCTPAPDVPVDRPDLRITRWTGCTGGSTIVAYRVTGGHRWPPSLAGSPTASVIWGFLAAHRTPPGSP